MATGTPPATWGKARLRSELIKRDQEIERLMRTIAIQNDKLVQKHNDALEAPPDFVTAGEFAEYAKIADDAIAKVHRRIDDAFPTTEKRNTVLAWLKRVW